eukprot:583084-Rhodomonas_salina.1
MPVERAAAGSPLVVAGANASVCNAALSMCAAASVFRGRRATQLFRRAVFILLCQSHPVDHDADKAVPLTSGTAVQETMIGVGALAASQQNKSKQVLLWRHWGGWAVHGGIDLAAFSSEVFSRFHPPTLVSWADADAVPAAREGMLHGHGCRR